MPSAILVRDHPWVGGRGAQSSWQSRGQCLALLPGPGELYIQRFSPGGGPASPGHLELWDGVVVIDTSGLNRI